MSKFTPPYQSQNYIYVSIIVPMYNSERFIDDLLPCLVGQTLKEIEIILVNDGSTDKTLDKLREWAEKDRRIKIVNQENKGLSEARNAGISVAIGEYIWFVDADDFVFPECAETMYKEVDGRDYLISGCISTANRVKALQLEHRLEPTIRIFANNIEEMIKIKPFATWIGTVWRCLYKRDVIINNHLKFRFSRTSHEDTLFNYEFISVCNSCSRIDYQGYVYMNTPGSLGSQHKRNVNREWLEVTKTTIWNIMKRYKVKLKDDYSAGLHRLYSVDCTAFVTTGYHTDSSLPYNERMSRWKYLLTNELWMEGKRFGFITKLQKSIWYICRYRLYYIADPFLLLLTRVHDKIVYRK